MGVLSLTDSYSIGHTEVIDSANCHKIVMTLVIGFV